MHITQQYSFAQEIFKIKECLFWFSENLLKLLYSTVLYYFPLMSYS